MSKDTAWSHACLRITSETLSSKIISAKLGTEPTQSYEAGEYISRNKPLGARRTHSLWLFESKVARSEPLSLHIAQLISFVEEQLSVLNTLRSNCHIDIFCGFSSGSGQGGFVLEAELLKRIAVLNIDFILDLYPPEESEPRDPGTIKID